jgi:chromosome partitioning protein
MKIELNKLRTARRDKGITQAELSALSGVHLSVIKAVETGRNAERHNIERLTEALGIPIESIYLKDFRDTKVISIVNNKGGCGKTSVCGSLAYVLSEWDYRILLIDSDAQRNLTSSYGMPKGGMHFGRAIEREESLTEGYIQSTAYPNVDMVVADASMGTLDMLMFTKMHRENLVCQTLRSVVASGVYDYILIDTNPNLSLLNFNVVNASDHVIIPVQMASFDVEGIGTVVDFIRGIQKFNPRVNIMGIVINKYDMRTRSITEAAEQELRRIYGETIFNTYIKVDVKIQNAQWENRPVFTMGKSRVAREYRSLAKEVLARCKSHEMAS